MIIINKINNKQSGMSLVELMVALVISLFLSAGIFTMFSMSSSNVTTTSQFNQLQENGRIALAILERDISQLGFFGDMTGTEFIVGTNTLLDSNVAAADDCIGAGLNNETLPNNQPAHFRRLWAYESGISSESLTCLNGVSVVSGTDVIQIKRFVGPNAGNGDGTDSPVGNGSSFFVSSTSSQAVFFNGLDPSQDLLNSRVWEYQHRVYFIDTENGVPILSRKTLTDGGMTNDEQLVQGIENIRYSFGFDNDGDSTPDRFIPSSLVTSLMWDNESFQRLVAIKVYVLVRAIQEDSTYTNQTQYQLGDKPISAPNDNFRRKVMATTVVLENPVLIRN
ncbi:PilW family protein [Shewanella sp. KT0246]|uniref:PilW family protein n=1 Tax=Shewanella sp. KT0246 TaxID=2815912 RepID=UPI001BC6C995|nr:PilW family protein [Shewanella sp. KT0246]GIU51635.1 type IV minor pilin protein PilW [Shewanella sp. KT0246]